MQPAAALSIFDFDKTLVTVDSFRLFSLAATASLAGKTRSLALAIACKLGLISNTAYKRKILAATWWEKDEARRAACLDRFLETLRRYENPVARGYLHRHLGRGDAVAVVSASPEFYLAPYLLEWSDKIEVFGSALQINHDNTGPRNLYGDAKQTCIQGLIDRKKPSLVWVYTDHISDMPAIALADRVRLVKPALKLRRTLAAKNIPYEIIG